MRRDSVDRLEIKVPDTDPIIITPDDRLSFFAQIDEDPVTNQVFTMILRIESIRWRSPRWEFREPTIGLLWAIIKDEDFLAALDRGKQFEKGETLECSVRVRQWGEGEDGLRTNYTIESVLAHNPKDSGDQLSIE